MPMAQSTIVFDTHEAVRRLTSAGVPEPQAEAHVQLQAQLVEQNFATKTDIQVLGLAGETLAAQLRKEMADLLTEMTNLRTDMANLRTDMANLRTELKDSINLSYRVILGAQIPIAGVIIAAVKLF